MLTLILSDSRHIMYADTHLISRLSLQPRGQLCHSINFACVATSFLCPCTYRHWALLVKYRQMEAPTTQAADFTKR